MLELWLPWLVVLISAIGSVLAWIAKVRWSREFAQAKDAAIEAKNAEITAKDAQIKGLERELESLRSINPKVLREYNEAAIQSLREFIELLRVKLYRAEFRVTELSSELEALNSTLTVKGVISQEKESQINTLEHEKRELSLLVNKLRDELSQITTRTSTETAPFGVEELALMPHAAETAEEIDRALGTDEQADARWRTAKAAALILAETALHVSTGGILVPILVGWGRRTKTPVQN